MKSNILIFTLLSYVFLCSSCILEEDTRTIVNIKNNTEHSIVMYPYSNGRVDSVNILNFLSGEKHEIETFTNRGKSEVPVYFSNYFKKIDSLIVIWDNSYAVTHMVSDSFVSENKYVALLDARNIGNGKAYSNSILKEKKRSITWDVTYTFTEEDYLFAKD